MFIFDGINKIIILDDSSAVNVKDIYVAWKKWIQIDDNAKFLPTFRAIGGEELGAGVFLSSTYFLTNGWRIRPSETDYVLYVNGNLFVEEGGSPFVPTIGKYNVLINLNTSNIVNTVVVSGGENSGGGGITTQDKIDIANRITPSITQAKTSIINEIGPKLDNILGLVQHNFRMDNHVYDEKGLLVSSRIKLFPSGLDCDNNTNPITTYTVVAVYENEKLIDYRVRENA